MFKVKCNKTILKKPSNPIKAPSNCKTSSRKNIQVQKFQLPQILFTTPNKIH